MAALVSGAGLHRRRLICVNVAELRQGLPDFSPWRYGSGIALALGRWSAGPGMPCATPAGFGRTRINRR